MAKKIVRTPTKATGGITAEEKQAMVAHTALWIKRAMRTAPIEPDKIIPAIEGLYAAAKLKKPRVVIVPSPLVMAFASSAAAVIWGKRCEATPKSIDDVTHAATYDATRVATYNAAANATADATRAATANATRAATVNVTYDAVIGVTHKRKIIAATDTPEKQAIRACLALAGKDGLDCALKWHRYLQGGNMWVAWESYLTAFRDIIGLRLPEYERYTYWEQAAIHGGFRYMHPEFCMVSDFPEILRVDDQNRPHCENGPSHRWRDGWSLYYWHGVRVPAEWIEDKASLTPAIALKEKNAEKRRAACEIIGWNRILSEMKAKIIDKDDDPEIGELVEVRLEGNHERFLRVQCGTKREFALPVPPTMKTALEANAWTFDIDPDVLKQLEVRT